MADIHEQQEIHDIYYARKLIKECKETQNPYLDIGRCGITDLNDLPELFDCTHLETLILSNVWWDYEKNEDVNSKNIGEKNILSELPKGIGKLTNLRVLIACGEDVDGWEIDDISPLSNLTSLTTLDLRINQLTDISPLSNLTSLTQLDLRINQLTDISPLSNLTSLTELYLMRNQLTDISPLSNLTSLTTLDLSINQLTDIRPLSNLTTLTQLYLGSNRPTDIRPLSNLTSLTQLYLRGNQLTDISPLSNMTSLTRLDLSRNQLTDISPLSNLTSLTELDLRDNKLTDITPLSNLTSLTQLDLRINQLTDISPLSNLTSLTQLNLMDNKLTDLTPLSNLTSLTQLNLMVNKLTDLTPLSNLTSLTELLLYNNQLTDISPLSNLTSLTRLNLFNNQLTDISPLSNMTSLTRLDLISNNIDKIPEEIFKLNMDIKIGEYGSGLIIDENIESPPIEIIKQGKEAVFDWFAAVKAKFNEVKVILIGDGGAGKTSLLRRLQTGEFDEKEAQTDGINIEDIDFSKNEHFEKYEDLHPYKAHFWDFGGQEILNSTHQLFLTLRSIYIIVLNARKDETVESQIQKWVKQVRANGGNSPIIIVANQIDINPGFGFVNENQLRDEYKQIVGFIKLSSKSGFNFDKLKELLEDTIPRADLVNSEIDVKWIKLKDKLLEIIEEEQYLNEETFIDVCNKTGIADEKRRKNAISYFNDVGLLLHFENLMIDYYVLDPLWITYGVYQILTSQCVAEFNGIVPREKLSFILNDDVDKNKNYRSTREVNLHYNKQHGRFLIEALNRFKLCYCTEDNSKFVIPNHLKTTEPKELIESIKSDPESITFVYKYDYIPTYVIPNLMVKFHRALIDNWRTGFIIKQKQAKALIGSYKNMVTIIACGELHDKKIIMQRVRTYTQDINKKITPEPESLIPLPGINEYINYKELLYYQNKGDSTISKFKKNKVHEFDINKLLNGFEGVREYDLILEYFKIIYRLLQKQDKFSQSILDEIQSLKDIEINANEEVTRLLISNLNQAARTSENIDESTLKILKQINNTDDSEAKLKLAIPIIPLFVSVEAETSIKGWPKALLQSQGVDITAIEYYLDKLIP